MKKTYIVQLLIDASVVILGLLFYVFPGITTINPNMAFYLTMSVYAGLELCEYLFDRSQLEPFLIFLISLVATFAAVYLRNYLPNFVLAVITAGWVVMFSLIKVMNLENIYKRKTHLFIIKMIAMALFAMLGILISINLFYRLSTIGYMLALLFTSFGALEFGSDFITFLSEDTNFLKR